MWYYVIFFTVLLIALGRIGVLRAIWDLYRAPKRGERNDN